MYVKMILTSAKPTSLVIIDYFKIVLLLYYIAAKEVIVNLINNSFYHFIMSKLQLQRKYIHTHTDLYTSIFRVFLCFAYFVSFQIFSKEYINLLLTVYFFFLGVLALSHIAR